jgi:predicted dehydrogenase
MRTHGTDEEVMVSLRMTNGSLASIAYVIDGDPAGPKERLEMFGGRATGIIDDFRRASLSVNGRRRSLGGRFSTQDKGHRAEVRAFVDAVVSGSASPVPFADAVNSTRATFAVLRSLETGTTIEVARDV